MSNSENTPIPPEPENNAASEIPQFTMPEHSVSFSKKDILVVLAAAIEAVLWVIVFDPADMLFFGNMPGIGTTVFGLVNMACILLLIGKRGVYNQKTVPLIVASVCLMIVPAIVFDEDIRMLNLILLWCCCTCTAFAVAGLWPKITISLSALATSWGQFFAGAFEHRMSFARAIAAQASSRTLTNSSTMRNVLLGIAIALAVLVFVFPLLISAAPEFKNIFSGFLDWLYNFNPGRTFWDAVYAVVMFPLLAALLFAVVKIRPVEKQDETIDGVSLSIAKNLSAVTQITVLAILIVLYMVFAATQLNYLASGTQAVFEQGGYAQYARQGFFQLTAVAAINTVVILVSAQVAAHTKGKDRVIVRACALVLVALTATILASAFLRMHLYIMAYGLTMLRLMTLFGMAFITVLLIALIIKTLRPHTNFFAVFSTAMIALWIVFCFSNPAAVITNYNEQRYADDPSFDIDWEYLDSLDSKSHYSYLTQLPWQTKTIDQLLHP